MDQWFLNRVAALLFLADVKTAELDGGVLKLFKNDIQVSFNTVIGDLTEADFTGYAPITLTTWLAPYVNAANRGTILAGQKQFLTAAPYTVGNQVYGYWVETAGGVLLFCGRFSDAPRPMAVVGNALECYPNFSIGYAGP